MENMMSMALPGLLLVAVVGYWLKRSARGRAADQTPAIKEEERDLFERVLRVADLPKQARLRDASRWSSVEPGAVLMREDQQSPPLIYIAKGAVSIERGGAQIGTCKAGEFVGEMSLISGDRASATVVVAEPARIAMFDRDELVLLSDKDHALARLLDGAFNRGLAAKVKRMNSERAAD